MLLQESLFNRNSFCESYKEIQAAQYWCIRITLLSDNFEK